MKRAMFLISCVSAAVLLLTGRDAGRAGAAPVEEKVYFTCPVTVKLGVRDLPDGWNVVASKTLTFVEAQAFEKSQLLTCLYRGDGVGEHSIMRIAPEGYGCRLLAAGGREFVCTRRLKAPARGN